MDLLLKTNLVFVSMENILQENSAKNVQLMAIVMVKILLGVEMDLIKLTNRVFVLNLYKMILVLIARLMLNVMGRHFLNVMTLLLDMLILTLANVMKIISNICMIISVGAMMKIPIWIS